MLWGEGWRPRREGADAASAAADPGPSLADVCGSLDEPCRICLRRVEEGLREEARQRDLALRQLEARLRHELGAEDEMLGRVDRMRLAHQQQVTSEAVEVIGGHMSSLEERLAALADNTRQHKDELYSRLSELERSQSGIERLLMDSGSAQLEELGAAVERVQRDLDGKLAAEAAEARAMVAQFEGQLRSSHDGVNGELAWLKEELSTVVDGIRRELSEQLQQEASEMRALVVQLDGQVHGLQTGVKTELAWVKKAFGRLTQERDEYRNLLQKMMGSVRPLVEFSGCSPSPSPTASPMRAWTQAVAREPAYEGEIVI